MMNAPQINNDLRQELKRKSFHLLGLIYPLTLYWVGLTDFRILLIVFWIVATLFEVARLSHASFNDWMFEYFGDLFREKEKAQPSGVFWMLTGMLWIAFVVRTDAWIFVISLYVVFGDAAASLFGRWIGGPTWWRSKKTLAGSSACFVVCLSVGFLLLKHEVWYLMILGAILATVGEAEVLPINDNFSIPLFASLVSGLTL